MRSHPSTQGNTRHATDTAGPRARDTCLGCIAAHTCQSDVQQPCPHLQRAQSGTLPASLNPQYPPHYGCSNSSRTACKALGAHWLMPNAESQETLHTAQKTSTAQAEQRTRVHGTRHCAEGVTRYRHSLRGVWRSMMWGPMQLAIG